MKRYIYLFIALFISLNLYSQTNDALFKQANKLFVEKQYHEALSKYLEIEKKGVFSSELYYNMGNTYFRINDYANSILYYERAILLSPNNEDIQTNLNVAKARLKSDVYNVPKFFLLRWWNKISNLFTPSTWAFVSIVLLLISSFLFILYYFSFNKKILFFYSFILFLSVFIISCFAGISRQNRINSKDYAIIFNENTMGKDSPLEASSDKMKLQKGQKIKIIDKEEGWIKVKSEDGKEAWIKNKDIVII